MLSWSTHHNLVRVTKQVQLAFKALVEYDADGVSDCPHPSYALSFKKNHYLHMKQV